MTGSDEWLGKRSLAAPGGVVNPMLANRQRTMIAAVKIHNAMESLPW
jgi:hypothetical protein